MSIYRRKGGRYAVRIDIDPTDSGRRQRRSIGTYPTKKEAQAAEREALLARDHGATFSAKKCTVASLINDYLKRCEDLGHAAKTTQEYRAYADRLIIPRLGGILASKLRTPHVTDWVVHLLARGGRPVKQRDGTTREKPLSRKTVRHAYSLLSAAFNYAAEMDDRASLRNPCNNENLRKRLTVPDSKAVALTNAETIALLDAARGTRWEAFIDLALSLAFRRGELCALSWSDYNEEQHTLTVRHSLSQTKRGIALKEPKTKQIRTLPLSRIAITALAKQRGLQAADADAPYYENTEGAIFTDEAGQRITPMAASCAFERLARKAKLSTTRLHDLRHTAATRLLLSGADVRTVAGILGHSSPVTTLRVYAHLLPEAQREGVERLGQHLENLGKTADLTTDGHVMATSKVTVLRKPA